MSRLGKFTFRDTSEDEAQHARQQQENALHFLPPKPLQQENAGNSSWKLHCPKSQLSQVNVQTKISSFLSPRNFERGDQGISKKLPDLTSCSGFNFKTQKDKESKQEKETHAQLLFHLQSMESLNRTDSGREGRPVGLGCCLCALGAPHRPCAHPPTLLQSSQENSQGSISVLSIPPGELQKAPG
uniref:Uncharacterized protein n=1 Tax=Malurus cyaneus samueli TaxID=2593467 RepID=A0A8C5TPA7_9PASS